MEWILSSDRLPLLWDSNDLHFRYEGKKVDGEFGKNAEDEIVFEYRKGSRYIIVEKTDFNKLEWLDESLPGSAAPLSVLDWVKETPEYKNMTDSDSMFYHVAPSKFVAYMERYLKQAGSAGMRESLEKIVKLEYGSGSAAERIGNAREIARQALSATGGEKWVKVEALKEIQEHVDMWSDEPQRALRLIQKCISHYLPPSPSKPQQ